MVVLLSCDAFAGSLAVFCEGAGLFLFHNIESGRSMISASDEQENIGLARANLRMQTTVLVLRSRRPKPKPAKTDVGSRDRSTDIALWLSSGMATHLASEITHGS
jgi:hypothetical protein